jgi:Uma2 family endonuclease
MAVAGALMAELRGRPCVVLESNARVRVAATGNAYYPDASVVCGHLERDAEDPLSLANPTVLIEVLSPSTAEYDRTEKLHDYQRIGALQHVVHVAYDAPRIDVWTRGADGWTRESYGEGKRVVLPAIACELDVSEIFRDPLDPSQA